MGRGQRQPDTIALELDRTLDAEIRKQKFKLFGKIKENFHFQQLTSLAQGATTSDNDRLAHAILDASWNRAPVGPIIQKYAEKYIYPYRKKKLH